MKNIGILTYHIVPNFGAQLQTLSTVGFFKKKGYNPIVINWYPKRLEEYYLKKIPTEQIDMHYKFAKDFIPCSTICRTSKDIANVINDNDIQYIFVGSDAVLKIIPLLQNILVNVKLLFKTGKKTIRYRTEDTCVTSPFLGSFLKYVKTDIKLFMFSASSQDCRYNYLNLIEKIQLKKKLSSFTYISVRDKHTERMVNALVKKMKVEITPDPVFSFNNNLTFSLPSKDEILQKYNLNENYVLFSFRSEKFDIKEDFVIELKRELLNNNLDLVAFPHPDGLKSFNLEKGIDIPLAVLDWYCLIKYSSGYIGERMHPIIVSIHNNVPFVVFDEYGRKNGENENTSKIFHILEKAKLLENRIGIEDTFDSKLVADKLLSFNKNKELFFLKNQHIEYDKAMNIIDLLIKG